MSKFHPCSKEFQEEAKRLGLTGNQLMQRYMNEGNITSTSDIRRKIKENTIKNAGCKNTTEYRNKCAQNLGYKDAQEYNEHCYKNLGYEDKNDYQRAWRHDNCVQLPMSENKACAKYLGIYITERKIGRIIIPEMVEEIKQEMPQNYPGYDFITINDTKIDVKSCCSREIKNWKGWEAHIRFNNVTDYFLIVAFDNRIDLNIIHIWLIHKGDIIRGEKFWKRDSIKISDSRIPLMQFNRFDWIKKLNSIDNNNKTWS